MLDRVLAPLKVENLNWNREGLSLHANFFVDVGQRVALLGKSGSGKTTLLRLIAGLESMDKAQGKILLADLDIVPMSPQKRDIGLVSQDLALFSHLNVMENVVFGLRVRGVGRAEREKEASIWLDRVGLTPLANSPVERLSGGEKQRVAFIRALIWKPRLILLDEPFSALDPDLRTTVRDELVRLHAYWPAPLLLVTHDEQDLQAVATDRLYLRWEPTSGRREVQKG